MTKNISRRSLVKQMGTIGALTFTTALLGCSNNENARSTSRHTGYADDTEVKDYPVSLLLYADSNLKWQQPVETNTDAKNHLEELVKRYQAQDGRDQVSINIAFTDPPELLEMAKNNFTDGGDGIIALNNTIDIGLASGTIGDNDGNYAVRDLSYAFSDECVIVCALGSTTKMPDALTIDGEDSEDGTINKLQQLPTFEGKIAIVDPACATEGVMANKMLSRESLYSDASGQNGYYDESIADKLLIYPNQDSAMNAVATNECQLGFALRNQLNNLINIRYPKITQCYKTGSGGYVSYEGFSLSCSQEMRVMKDFFEFITAFSY